MIADCLQILIQTNNKLTSPEWIKRHVQDKVKNNTNFWFIS